MKMSTERLSFGLNSLIPETYKTKAEAFAKCLQHKLLSLGRFDTTTESYSSEPRIRLNENDQGEGGNFNSYTKLNFEKNLDHNQTCESERSGGTCLKISKTEESDEEFCSHSESEGSDFSEQKKRKEKTSELKQKLTSMSSEDSTVESWSSCQEDLEKFDSENEDLNFFASQIKGSPKLRNSNIRGKRKETRDKPWKKSTKKNHSSSTENVDYESRNSNHSNDNFDSESHPQFILLDGFEDDEIPHRILRESSSTSSLEKHFSRLGREESREYDFPKKWKTKPEHKAKEECITNPESLTPPSPSNFEKTGKKKPEGKEDNPQTDISQQDEVNDKKQENLLNGLKFAELATDSEVEFNEVESMKDFNIENISRSVKKMNGMIVECPSDSPRTELDISHEWMLENVVVSKIEVYEPSESKSAKEEQKEILIVEPPKDSEEKSNELTDDELLNARAKLRRSSSLKTWKTPPGTPGGKKIVRFADALGLDLADVRTFLDEIPKIPSSAYADLNFTLPPRADVPALFPTPTLFPFFQQPGSKMDFLEKVQQQKICLETALVTDMGILMVSGYVRVHNMSFHKTVHVRYTINNWQTFSDLQATYVPNSCDGFSDKFSFNLFGHTLRIGDKLEFALRMECCGTQYWDNNGGINYVFNCLPHNSLNSFPSSLYNEQSNPWFDFF